MENIIARYKKVCIGKNLYLYVFVKAIEDVEYDFMTDTVTYYKNNRKKTLFNMEDPYFTISDDKDCYSDLLYADVLEDTYDTDDVEEIKKNFIEDCSSFLRFGILDEEKEIVKIINTSKEDIKNARPDSHFYEFMCSIDADYKKIVTIPEETLESLISSIEEDTKEEVLKTLYDMRNSIQVVDEMMDEYNIKSDKDEEECEKKAEKLSDKTIEDSLKELDGLVGLSNIKKQVSDLQKYLRFLNITKDYLNIEDSNLNMIFFGNPGTGKTTVSRIIAKILYQLGYVKEDKFVETTAQDFIAGYVGQTAIKARKLLDQNKGGIIFIDEAYVFAGDSQNYAQEALVEILKDLEKKETLFIFAGYKEEMKNFIDMNPGLQSRVGYYFDFRDYSEEELLSIFLNKIEKTKLKLEIDAKESITAIIEKEKTKGERNFGNGRYIDKLFDKMLVSHAVNVDDFVDKETLSTITKNDIDKIELENMNMNVKVKKLGF